MPRVQRNLDDQLLGRAAVILLAALALYGVALRVVSPWHAFYWNDEVWTSLQSSGHSIMSVVQATHVAQTLTAGDLVALQGLDASSQLGTFLESDPHTSPLFYWLCWSALHFFGNHVHATRALTATLGCLGLLAVFLMSRALSHSRLTAWLALALAAVSPVQLYMSYDARPYVLWFATSALATYAFLRAHRVARLGHWLVYALAATLMLYSHLYGVFVLAAHAAYAAASPVTTRSTWLRFAAALGIALLACTPWLLWIGTHLRAVHVLTGWLSQPASTAELRDSLKNTAIWQFATYASLPSSLLAQWVAVALTVATLGVSLLTLWRKGPREVASLVTVLVFALPLFLLAEDALAGGRRFTITRYYVPSWLGLTFAVAWFMPYVLERCMLAVRSQAKALTLISALAIAGLFASASSGAWAMFRSPLPEGKPDEFAALAAQAIARSTHPVVVSPGLVTMAVLVSNGVPAGTPIVNLRTYSVDVQAIVELAQHHDVFWLRPAPEPYFEPRRSEASDIERRLGQALEIRYLTPFCARLLRSKRVASAFGLEPVTGAKTRNGF